MAQGPFCKFYHCFMDEYPEAWSKDAQLAAFMRLLVLADKFYPQWAPVSRRTSAYKALVAAGLVIESVDGLRYTVKGLEAERERRSAPGRTAAAVRWHSDRNATAMPTEQSRTEKSNGAVASDGSALALGYRRRPSEREMLADMQRQQDEELYRRHPELKP